MREYSQLQKIITVLIISILMIQLSGCYSSRIISGIISSSDLAAPDHKNYHYIVYSRNLRYSLENAIVSNGILSGKINMENTYSGNAFHISLYSDSLIKINTENILRVPLYNIVKVKVVKNETGEIILIVGSCVILFLVIIGGTIYWGMHNWHFSGI
jgi:hypothetical protein